MKIIGLRILILSSLIGIAQPAVASESAKVKPSPSLPTNSAQKSEHLPLLKKLKDEVRQGNDASHCKNDAIAFDAIDNWIKAR